MERTEAQKEADKRYAEKIKENRASINITRDLRDRIKARADAEGVTMVELIERLLAK